MPRKKFVYEVTLQVTAKEEIYPDDLITEIIQAAKKLLPKGVRIEVTNSTEIERPD